MRSYGAVNDFMRAIFPSLHHRKEGGRATKKLSRASMIARPGVFPIENKKENHPLRSFGCCANYLTTPPPPCGDARRGMSPDAIIHRFL